MTGQGELDIAPVLAKTSRRLMPFLFLLCIVAYLDRINVGFAALQMNRALGFSATTYGFGFWLPQMLKAASGASDFVVGLLSAIPYAAGAIAMVIVGRHSDRTGERRWHVAVPAIVGAAALALSTASTGIAWSVLTLSVAMLGLASMFGPFWALTTSTMGGVGAAASIALVNSVGKTGRLRRAVSAWRAERRDAQLCGTPVRDRRDDRHRPRHGISGSR